MGTVVRRNIVESILGIMGKKAMEAIFPEKSHHFQMVVFEALKDLGGKKRGTCHVTETDYYSVRVQKVSNKLL